MATLLLSLGNELSCNRNRLVISWMSETFPVCSLVNLHTVNLHRPQNNTGNRVVCPPAKVQGSKTSSDCLKDSLFWIVRECVGWRTVFPKGLIWSGPDCFAGWRDLLPGSVYINSSAVLTHSPTHNLLSPICQPSNVCLHFCFIGSLTVILCAFFQLPLCCTSYIAVSTHLFNFRHLPSLFWYHLDNFIIQVVEQTFQ